MWINHRAKVQRFPKIKTIFATNFTVSGNIKIYQWLYPLAWIYGLIVSFRNKLFDWGVVSSETFPVPVISIGNITVGGTGKTPHTEYLIGLLSKKYRVAVLSRGYKRKTQGFVLAGKNTNYQQIGDEPMQMQRKFPSVLVAVDANRRRGIRKLLQLPGNQKPEVILLDDAFQHRYVKPSLSILLTDCLRPFYGDCVLPAGRLREPPDNYKRADWIVCTKCPETYSSADYQTHAEKIKTQPHQQLFFSSYRYKNLVPVFPEANSGKKEIIENPNLENYTVSLISGLANPSGLIEYVKKHASDLQITVYPDHHDFTQKDIQSMKTFINTNPDKKKLIIISEKDAARLINNPFVPCNLKDFIYYLPIEVVIRFNEELFTQKIENHVANFERNRIVAETIDT
jgi:tetraacyldisaccharide 4'-kinase